jgi:hypothetical protein
MVLLFLGLAVVYVHEMQRRPMGGLSKLLYDNILFILFYYRATLALGVKSLGHDCIKGKL